MKIITLYLLINTLLAGCMQSDNRVLAEGVITLQSTLANSSFDFDQQPDDVSTHDISFQVAGRTNLFLILQPINNSFSYPYYSIDDYEKRFELPAPDYAACKDKLNSFTQTNIPESYEGNYICLLTNSNHLARVHIEKVNRNENGIFEMEIEYIVWSDTVEK